VKAKEVFYRYVRPLNIYVLPQDLCRRGAGIWPPALTCYDWSNLQTLQSFFLCGTQQKGNILAFLTESFIILVLLIGY